MELLVLLWSRELVGNLIAHLLACVILLAIEDSRVLHRACNARLPVLKVGTVELLRAVGIGKLQHATESTLCAPHTMLVRSHNLIAPPAWSNLRRKLILGIGSLIEGVGKVISKRATSLENVGKARFEVLVANGLAVEIDLIDTQTGCHPLGRCHLALVLHHRHKPACAIGCTVVVPLLQHGSINSREPDGRVPRLGIKSLALATYRSLRATAHQKDGCASKAQQRR